MLISRASEAAYIKSGEASTPIRAISAWRCDLIGINSEHAAFHEGSRRSKLVDSQRSSAYVRFSQQHAFRSSCK